MKLLKQRCLILAVATCALQVLSIAGLASANSDARLTASDVASGATKSETPDYRNKIYRVKKGDKFEDIAQVFGLDPAAFAAWNNQRNPELIYIGQPLRLFPSDPSGLSGQPIYIDKPETVAPVSPTPITLPAVAPTPTAPQTAVPVAAGNPQSVPFSRESVDESVLKQSISIKNPTTSAPLASFVVGFGATEQTASTGADLQPRSSATTSLPSESSRPEPLPSALNVAVASQDVKSVVMPSSSLTVAPASNPNASRVTTGKPNVQAPQGPAAPTEKLVLSPEAASLLVTSSLTTESVQAAFPVAESKKEQTNQSSVERKLVSVPASTLPTPIATLGPSPELPIPANSIVIAQPILAPTPSDTTPAIASAPAIVQLPIASSWQAAKPTVVTGPALTAETSPLPSQAVPSASTTSMSAGLIASGSATSRPMVSIAPVVAAESSAAAPAHPGVAPAIVATFPVKEADQIRVTELDPRDSVKRRPKGGKQDYSPEALQQMQERERIIYAEAASTPPETAHWTWPLAGAVIAPFIVGTNNGIDLGGKIGDPVVAVADGRVVYAGLAVMGFGKLVVVRHTADYVSIYAHAKDVAVAEGQDVTKGQKVAEVGGNDSERPKLHFEIHFQGKPVDPQKTLPPR